MSLKSFHNISANFFFLLAFIYVALALFVKLHIYSTTAILLMQVLDSPFVLISLLYGASGLYLQINEGKTDINSTWTFVIMAISIILFMIFAFINFALPSFL